jgi:glycine/D-amino acid oxidase-like deaminating enzyme/nitrite reductase/ring-hydroxylating ferredoxin subunit
MNVGDEASFSVWMEEAPVANAIALTADAECDVVIVGSGLAGMSTAYELARTTAHLATQLDDFYSELIDVRGEDEARLYCQSVVAAVDRIEAICRKEGIEADFARLDGYLFAAEEDHRAHLQEEFEACGRIGFDVAWADRAPIPDFDTGRCLRFPDQGRFHPTRYLAGLARAIQAYGGKFYANTVHVADKEVDGGVEITTEAGPVIRAKAAVFATNSPTNDKVAIHPKQVPMRTYVIAGRVAKGSVPDALVWDTYEAYHYVRIQPLNKSKDLLIVGGEDHRSGEADDMEARLRALEKWARKLYPSLSSIDYRWSGQVMETIDFMPFSGRNPGNRNVYIHTGDSGQGITNGVAGSLAIAALILSKESRFAKVLDPGRKSASAASSIAEFVKGQAGAVKNFAEYLGPGEVSSVKELGREQGAILRQGLSKVAAYRDKDGEVVLRSAVCTHLGCIVHWNSFEKCWDCPCHGSQFAPNGHVLNGPAVYQLEEAEADG